MSTRLDLSTLSLMDALDLAKLIEMEACHRYQMFAQQIGTVGDYDAGGFFASRLATLSAVAISSSSATTRQATPIRCKAAAS